MLRIEDLRDDKRKSGFRHVGSAGGTNYRSRGKPWVGYAKEGRTGWTFRGPRRATPEEAAQDYCDYVNGQSVAPATPLRSAGHSGRRAKLADDPEVRAALGILRDARAKRSGQRGYVYCIREVLDGGGIRFVKIGYSTDPQARVAELQTGNPRPLALVCMKEGSEADEKALQQKYVANNVLQEWFTVTKDMLLEFDLDENGKEYASQ